MEGHSVRAGSVSDGPRSERAGSVSDGPRRAHAVRRLRFRLVTGALAFLCTVGCARKQPPAPTNTFAQRLEGGSTTIPGKARDKAVDVKIEQEMRQVRTAIEADAPNGNGPADDNAWRALLRDCPTLHGMFERGDLIANPGVNVLRSPPETVLMYERRAAEGDGIVLFCDGTARRVTSKEEFKALRQPK